MAARGAQADAGVDANKQASPPTGDACLFASTDVSVSAGDPLADQNR
ncbi:hypothetical protein LN449_06540 [Xanthomonas cannabis]|nr:hypothetical protein [Xanthomonas cannabis]MCC8442172.1 hypothetical protein [Xanthomonas cannabis]